MKIGINYSELVDAGLRQVLRGALEQVAEEGMPGDHHFYITFITDFPGVSIPSYLKARYENKMTIVVQHQFNNLQVWDNGFKISLSFSGVSEKLEIPFAAVVEFADPFVNFALQFQSLEPDNDAENDLDTKEATDVASQDLRRAKALKPNKSHKHNKKTNQRSDQSVKKHTNTVEASTVNDDSVKDRSNADNAGNVIALDTYRRP